MTPLDIALEYIARGWNPLPLPFRSKRPEGSAWQSRIIDAATAPLHFNGVQSNIGIILGPSSRGLTDIDLDCQEAIAVAPFILPRTGAIFGRPSKRSSHWLYYSDLSVTAEGAAQRFVDPKNKQTLVELRIGGDKGAQTVFPGSTHESGELISWEADGEPADVKDLEQAVRKLAACSLLARYWPRGKSSRHDLALAIGGFLARAGLPPAQVKVAVEAIARAAGDEEWRDRRQAAEDTATAFQQGKRTRGYPSLREAFGADVAEKVAEWLNYSEDKSEDKSNADDDVAAEEGEQKSPPLLWLDMSTWDDAPIPERKWAIKDRVPLNQAGLFSGEGGTGKSILELMKNVAHVAAKDWLGSLPELGPAFYIGAEDEADEIHRRLAAIANHYNVAFKEMIEGGLHVLCLLGQDATLCAANGKSGKVETTGLYRQIFEAAGDIKPKNISIDTLSRAFAGNEIDRVQVYAFAMHMQALAMVAGGSVTVLSHPSLSGIASGSGISGSTAWHGAFRFRQYLKGVKPDSGEQPDGDLRELEFKKNQYGPSGAAIVLRYQHGLFLPEGGMNTLEKLAAEQAADNLFLELLDKFQGQGRHVSHIKTSKTYAPTMFANDPKAKAPGIRKSLTEAMERLFAAKKIKAEQYGPPSKHHQRIVRCNPREETA